MLDLIKLAAFSFVMTTIICVMIVFLMVEVVMADRTHTYEVVVQVPPLVSEIKP